ncbi:hypothetical protein BDV93DRAFT_516732 [Ceratobasidium sp. AG-I]|nr:hypothetical protein BDV93DRAFT_516732 [Ceratobasidium sp. AG-I]
MILVILEAKLWSIYIGRPPLACSWALKGLNPDCLMSQRFPRVVPLALRQPSSEHAAAKRHRRSSTMRMAVVVLIPGRKSGHTRTHATSEGAATLMPTTMSMIKPPPTPFFPLPKMSPRTHSPILSGCNLAVERTSRGLAPRLADVMAGSRATLDAVSGPVGPRPRLPMTILKCPPSQLAKHLHTYIYESIPHEVFMQYAKNRLSVDTDLKDRPTANILEMLRVKEADQAIKVGSLRHKTSIVMLSPEPIAVGGGWHRNWIPSVGTSQGAGPRPAKRAADEPVASDGLSKWQRATLDPVLADNTDTESESDDYVVVPTSPTPAGPLFPPASQCAALSQPCSFAVPSPSLPPLRGTQALPPSREPTTSTLLNSPRPSTQPSRSHSLGGSLPRSVNTSLPILPRLDYLPRDPTHQRLCTKVLAKAVDELQEIVGDEEDDKLEETEDNETGDAPGLTRLQPSAQKATTYQGSQQSHLPSNPGACSTIASGSSKSTAQDSLLAMERTQAAAEQWGVVLRRTRRKEARPRHLPPSTQAQPGCSTGTSEPHGSQSQRNNSVSAARADMLAYNQELVEGRVRSTIQDAICHNRFEADEEMRVQPGPTCNRPLNGLMDDNEETCAHAKAFAAGTFPEGIYQTRATFLNWAQLSHYDTWSLLLTKVTYTAATDSELEVMVNYLATLRGKVKEHLRPIVAEEYSPRKGHYKSPHLARFIAAGLFHGPTSVGMQFPEFFEEMPLTMVAFILVLWQFGLEEWSPRWFQPKELGASYMLDKYEAHLAGLKELHNLLMTNTTVHWEYSGAAFIPKQPTQDITLYSELRPDSPDPQFERERDFQPSLLESQRLKEEEEEAARLMQHARLESLKQASQDNDQFFAAHTDFLAANDNTSRSPTPSLPIEYNNKGCLTAAAKGKHRSS